MKTSLPTVKKITAKGFTLVELMVVIAIIAVLATVALTLFQNSQRGARNARRQADLQAMANAMETHYNSTTASGCVGGVAATYCAMADQWFSQQITPTDPVSTAQYCESHSTTVGSVGVANMGVNATGTCNGVAAGNFTAFGLVANGAPVASTTAWKICAQIEPFGTAGNVFCVSNQQS